MAQRHFDKSELQPDAPAVDVWVLDLDVAMSDRSLSPDEASRAQRFVFSQDRQRFVSAHAQAREVLADYLGVSAATVPWVAAPSGKPYLQGCAVSVSLSHSWSVGLLAISAGGQIGVDVERNSTALNVAMLSEEVLSPGERDRLASMPADIQQRRFLQFWTAKEAIAKASGMGLSLDFRSIDVDLTDWPRVRTNATGRDAIGSPWHVVGLSVSNDSVAALASDREPHAVRLCRRESCMPTAAGSPLTVPGGKSARIPL